MKRKTKPDIRAITQLKQEAARKAARASKIDVVELIKAAGLRYYDKRSQGGLLWLLGSMERLEFVNFCRRQGILFIYRHGGSWATVSQHAWWYAEDGLDDNWIPQR